MYFTREPIIETIISPREGYKLILRSSKHNREEEYSVDSVEVISFGNHSFYRSLDRSETFLLPVFDYEVVEMRSARLALKSGVPQEKEIKIGKPREVKPIVQEERRHEERRHQEDRKRESKRLLKKQKDRPKVEGVEDEVVSSVESEKVKPVERESLSRILIPPPSSLISDTLSRYQMAAPEEVVADEVVAEEHSVVNVVEERDDEGLRE